MTLRRCAAVACALALASCAPEPDAASDRFAALGTLVTVTVRAMPPDERPPVLREVRSVFARTGTDLHGWGDGALARHNDARGTGVDVPLPPAAVALLARADRVRDRSDGLFDPRLGTLVEAWGFHAGERAPGPPPDAAAIERARQGTRIDLGGIAKGAAVAEALAVLRAAGVVHALVDAGGDLAALGDAGGRPWRIAVRDPRGNGVVAALALADGEAVFTSGDYERVFEWDGERYHHLLDPRSGVPARGTASMTVVHADPVLADAAVTALFVAGDDWVRIAHALGIAAAMRVRADGRIEATPAFAERAEFPGAVPTVVGGDATGG